MDRARKEELVTELSQSFGDAALVVVTQQSGMTVAESTDLRGRMREAGAGYKVTKNRLAKLALAGTTYEQISDLFNGPTAIAYSADPVAAARVAVNYSKENDKLVVIGGAMGDTLLDENAVKALASLPSLDELRGKLVGMLNTPATRVAGVLQAPAGQLARVIGAYANQSEAAQAGPNCGHPNKSLKSLRSKKKWQTWKKLLKISVH